MKEFMTVVLAKNKTDTNTTIQNINTQLEEYLDSFGKEIMDKQEEREANDGTASEYSYLDEEIRGKHNERITSVSHSNAPSHAPSAKNVKQKSRHRKIKGKIGVDATPSVSESESDDEQTVEVNMPTHSHSEHKSQTVSNRNVNKSESYT
jgi:hypothetical protein